MNLVVDNVSKQFGGVAALDEASLEIAPGEVVGLVGPNGAGKTTLVNVVTGVFAPDVGSVTVRGDEVTGKRIEYVARRGVSRTYQHIRLFEDASVLENVLVGAHQRFEGQGALWPRARRTFDRAQRIRAAEECERLGLAPVLDREASELSYGQRRRVEMARALVCDPVVLMLDEPVAGMAPDEADAVGDLVRSLGGGQMSVILIEHNVALVSRVCDRLAVLDWGKIIKTGHPDEVWSDPAVRAAYLGPEKEDGTA